ncbi:hypothetical protein H2248_009631 [Termitomyces sp. 'cryptogamus']|nr:hypothetical protein H2248_009631 [Termitomyces sp. 'cryptogamus']
MASLPAKPQSSPARDAPSRFQDERDRRPRPQHYRTDDRSYPRRWPSGGDSYAPAYEPRREIPEYYRRELDSRPRRPWDRPDVDTHFGRGPSDYDYRGYERRSHYVSNPRHRDPYVRRDVSRWPSRSPSRRDRSRSRSPYAHKRVKLGNHSVDTSPRRSPPHKPGRYSRSRSRDAFRRPRSRSPRWESPASSNPVKTEEGATPDLSVTQDTGLLQTTKHDLEASHQNKSSGLAPSPQDFLSIKKEKGQDIKIPAEEEVGPQTDQKLSVAKDEFRSPPSHQLSPAQKCINLPSHLQEPLHDKQTKEYGKLEEEKLPIVPSQSRARSPSPPRQPRQRGPPSSYPSHRSRSPPKGPRNHLGTHPRGHITPTAPASSHLPGPRGQRRPFAPQNSLPTPQTQSPVIPSLPTLTESTKPTSPQTTEVIKVPLPAIPVKQLPESPTEQLDKEIARLQLQRAHLTTDYTNLAKEVRRALHELDTTTIDLHAAELRRKVADAQHEKARCGLLGIDYTLTAETKLST